MKRILSYLLLAVLLVPMGCTEDPLEEPKEEPGIRYYGNLFAYNIMKTYYLWEAEVSGGSRREGEVHALQGFRGEPRGQVDHAV